jgi:hypothetical protein
MEAEKKLHASPNGRAAGSITRPASSCRAALKTPASLQQQRYCDVGMAI